MRTMTRVVTGLVVALVTSTALGLAPAHATAPGENGRIAFRRYFNDAQTRGAIFTINPDGSGERRLTHQPASRVTVEADWSPNGHWIVYNVWPQGDDNRSRIHKIRANGTEHTYLDSSCTGSCLSDGFAQWSPSGRQIVFQRGEGPAVGQNNVFAIVVMRADGTHARQLTQRGADPAVEQPYEDLSPTWSPTGKRVAFVRERRSTGDSALFTMRADGTGPRRITRWALRPGQPDWSPGGRWIAFYAPADADAFREVALIHPDGTGLHRITSGAGTWGSLSFSPNGLKITVSHRGSQQDFPDVYTMNINGTHVRHVTHTPDQFESSADWGPPPS